MSSIAAQVRRPDFDRERLAEALDEVGVRAGDVVFSHGNIGFFGTPREGRDPDARCAAILEAFEQVLGPDGTLVVPTFTYSFCRRATFDVDATPSTCGAFTEWMRRHDRSVRSHDPLFSVTAIGARARELTENVSRECFGKGSFWDRLLESGGLVCNLNFDAGSTFLHYVEKRLNVPYRFDKLFTGRVRRGTDERKSAAIYFCRDQTRPEFEPCFEPFDRLARQEGIARQASVGRGAIVALRAADAFELVEHARRSNPWILTRNGETPDDRRPRTEDAPRIPVPALPPNAGMRRILDGLWTLPRDIVSDGYDAALAALSRQIPMTVHSFPTGYRAWSWIVPEKWQCRHASLQTVDGRTLFSYDQHPLHVVSYSLPFSGEVSREELFGHLHTLPHRPDAVPFRFQYYERDWGLCCTDRLKRELRDSRYRVEIDTQFSAGELKVGEVVAPGSSRESIVLCAHLCHPHMAVDDLSGVVVGLEVMRRLRERSDRHYTVRLLLVPETIGSLAWLHRHEGQIPAIRGGLFLEMLGLDEPHALQLSYTGRTEVDTCFTQVLAEEDDQGWTGPFRSIIGNDERQFNAPGIRIPMLSLSRVRRPGTDGWPYPEYHSSDDTPELVHDDRLEQSCRLVLSMLEGLEHNRVPVNQFKGEVFCSRYGLHVDFYDDPSGNRSLFDVLYEIDGTRSLAAIARDCRLPLSAVRRVADALEAEGLISYRRHAA